MNYQKIYNQLVERALVREKPNCYTEKHHIIPRCMGGDDSKENLVILTAREHFLCHWLLTRIYLENTKLGYAFWCMCNQKTKDQQNRYTPSSKTYEEARLIVSKLQSKPWPKSQKTLQLIAQANKNKTIEEKREISQKISKSLLGKKKSPEALKNCTEANRLKSKDHIHLERKSEAGKKLWSNPEYREKMLKILKSEEVNIKRSNTLTGSKRTPEQIENIRKGHLNSNYKYTEEHKLKISQSSKKRWEDPDYRKRMSEIKKSK